MQSIKFSQRPLAAAILAATLGWNHTVHAASEPATAPEAEEPQEVLVIGRQLSGAQRVVEERLQQPYAAELMDAEQITRAGDSNVSIALTRVTGVTLVDGKYVYVRSLGERYSSTLLNGASVPSPELTRNVLPLDLIPSSIVQTLKVQKAYSPDLPAHFGGGAVDIRTKTVPDELVASLSLGSGKNFSSDDGLGYASQGEAHPMPGSLREGVNRYQGNISQNNIWEIDDTDGGSPQADELKAAAAINRGFIGALNRNVEIAPKSLSPDSAVNLALGNSFAVTDELTLGAMLNYSEDSKWRNKDQTKRSIGSPDANYSTIRRTSHDTRELGALILGAEYDQDHSLQASLYNISNVQDEAKISTGFDGSNYTLAKGAQALGYDTRYEDRQLSVAQLTGTHKFEQLSLDWLEAPSFDWFYSEAKAETDIPNRTSIHADNTLNPSTGEVLATQLSPAAGMANFEFLTLDDKVESFGWNAKTPLVFDDLKLDLSGGYRYNDKVREYYGYTASLSGRGNSAQVLGGNVGRVLSDANISDLNNSFELTMGGGFGTESYVAAEITEGAYGMFDATWDETWRLTGGARYETYRRALLPVDLLDYTGQWVQKIIRNSEGGKGSYYRSDDGWFPSLAGTYIRPGFMEAETFQLRLSYSQTTVRPDLRETSDVTYIDFEANKRVQGNPLLKPSTLDHFDLRAEWLYASGDNFTATLFYKDLQDPIETTNVPGSDDDVVITFENSLSGKVFGLELEGLKNLDYGFFVSSNLTLSESEIVSPEGVGYTNAERPMTGQSQYVINTQLGFDSEDEKHSAAVVYNFFGERLFFAARSVGGYQDAYEQPFHSLDATYSYFPTEQWTLKAKLGNVLGQERRFEQVDSQGRAVEILTQEVGTSLSIDVKYTY